MGKQWSSERLYFWGSKIIAYSDCSHEIKRNLLLGRKVMTNLDSILKSRDVTLPTKVHLVRAMLLPVVMWELDYMKAEHRRIDAFELRCWRRLLRVLGLQGDPTSQSWRKSTLNIHWKDWCWSWSSNTLATWCKELTHWKRLWYLERLKTGGEGDTEVKMVGRHHWLDRHEFEQALGVGDRQGSLSCCGSWGHKELDTTELNWKQSQ